MNGSSSIHNGEDCRFEAASGVAASSASNAPSDMVVLHEVGRLSRGSARVIRGLRGQRDGAAGRNRVIQEEARPCLMQLCMTCCLPLTLTDAELRKRPRR